MFPLCNSSSISSTPKFSAVHFLPNVPSTSKIQFQFQPPRSSTTRVFAAPEALEQTLEIEDPESSTVIVGSDSDKVAPKQKIRIKLRSYWVPLIEDSCKQKRIYCVQ